MIFRGIIYATDRARRLYKVSQSSLTISPNVSDLSSSNKSAIQLIQDLFKINEQNTRSNTRNTTVIQEAFKIYEETKEELQNHALINVLLKGLFHFKQPDKVSMLWNRIQTLSQHNHAISYPLLLDCCIKSSPCNISEAIKCLELMKFQKYVLHRDESELFSKNVCRLISKCNRNLHRIKEVHSLVDHIDDIYIQTALINAYGPNSALSVFDSIDDTKKNNVAVGAMMKVLVDHNRGDQALDIYDRYRSLIDDISAGLALRACIITKQFQRGIDIHSALGNSARSIKSVTLKNVLIDFYAHFGDMTKAKHIYHLNEGQRDVITIGTMLKGYVNANLHEQALALYDSNIDLHDDICHTLALKSCIQASDFEKGKNIEAQLSQNHGTVAKTTLIDFYAHFGHLRVAESIFHSIDDADIDVVAINAMMTAYIGHSEYVNALSLYEEYAPFPSLRNDTSHILAVNACTKSNDFSRGKAIHSAVGKTQNVDLKNVLIDFYGTFQDLSSAQKVFDSIPKHQKDIISINAMMKALCSGGLSAECIQMFYDLNPLNPLNESVLEKTSENMLIPDAITFATALRACAQGTIAQDTPQSEDGIAIHEMLQSEAYSRYLEESMIQIHLINMYGKNGMMTECEDIFNAIPASERKEIGLWNAMMAAYGRNRDISNTERIFEEMKRFGIKGDGKTYKILISSYSHCGEVGKAQSLWMNSIDDDELKYDPFVVSTMIDAFSRTGMVFEGYELLLQYEQFTQSEGIDDIHKEVMWTTLLSGCRKHGDESMAEMIDSEMKQRMFMKDNRGDGDNENLFSFSSDTSASSSSSSGSGSGSSFGGGGSNFGGNSGGGFGGGSGNSGGNSGGSGDNRDNGGQKKVERPTGSKMSNLSEAARAETMGTASVLMSNIFGSGANFDKVNEIRAEMKRRGWKKKPGFSEIDVYGTLHRFYAGWGYRKTPEYKIIDKKLEAVCAQMADHGYKRDYSAITRQLKDWETPDAVLNRHGEKLAVIYGLLTTQPDYLIVVNKNIRICVDCHNWMKMVSKIEQRKLIIADNNRVHTFEDGKCTCRDYW